MKKIAIALTVLAISGLSAAAGATTTVQTLPFSQDWSNAGLITTNDDWSGVPGIMGYRGDDAAGVSATNPQTITADFSAVVDVNANNLNPNTFSTGGVTEFDIADDVVAVQGSGTADHPHLVLHVSTAGLQNILVRYNLRDIDGALDNAIQPVALQYRVGNSGPYTDVPAGFVADASTGPSLAVLVTPVSATLPAAADNQAEINIRIITSDAVGSDEWIGIDDISVTGIEIPVPTEATSWSAIKGSNR